MLGRRLRSIVFLLLGLSLAACGEEAVPACGETNCGGGGGGPGVQSQVEAGADLPPDPTGRADRLLDFGRIAAGTEMRLPLNLVNGGASAVGVSVEGPEAPFALADGPTVLGAGVSAALDFAFEPKAGGMAEGMATVEAGATSARVRLAGEGVRPVLDCPDSVELLRVGGLVEPGLVVCTNPTDVGFRVVATWEGAFSVSATATEVAPGGTVTFEIQAHGGVVGRETGHLVLTGPLGPLDTVLVNVDG